MPTFRSRQPSGFALSVRDLVTSSPQLSGTERIGVERAAAQTAHSESLAEKAREEIERERRAEQMRRDPTERARYGATTSGLTVPQGMNLLRFIEGGEGAARPEDITPEQERAFRTAIGSLLANLQATGRSNAQQLTGGGGNLLESAIRNEITAPNLPIGRENQLAHAIGVRAREPFSNVNPQGLVTQQETGDVTIAEPQLATAARNAVTALGAQRQGAADYSAARADRTRTLTPQEAMRIAAQAERTRTGPAPRPAPGRTSAQEERDRAHAEAQRLRNERLKREDAQTQARAGFRNDPAMRGKKLGRWVDGKGFQVLDESNVVVGFYD